MFLVRADQFFRRHFDSQVHHVIAVVLENNFHQVFADVVDVAFDRRQDHLGAPFDIRLLHEGFQVADGGLHRFRGLQHFGHDEFVVVEEPPHLRHPGHQRSVDHIERRRAFRELPVQIVDQTVLRSFDDVICQALVERQIGRALLFARPRGAKMSGDRSNVKLIDGRFLFA